MRAFSRRTVAPTDLPVSLDYIATQALRLSDSTEYDWVERAIKAATDLCEEQTQEALMPQTWQLVLDRFPWGDIVLPRPPLISVDAIAYFDGDNALQTLTGSPAQFEVVLAGQYEPARVRPSFGTCWPSTACRPDAVTITFVAGYADADDIPESYITGIALCVGELYKQRSLSVQMPNNTPATLNLDRFWPKAYV